MFLNNSTESDIQILVTSRFQLFLQILILISILCKDYYEILNTCLQIRIGDL